MYCYIIIHGIIYVLLNPLLYSIRRGDVSVSGSSAVAIRWDYKRKRRYAMRSAEQPVTRDKTTLVSSLKSAMCTESPTETDEVLQGHSLRSLDGRTQLRYFPFDAGVDLLYFELLAWWGLAHSPWTKTFGMSRNSWKAINSLWERKTHPSQDSNLSGHQLACE